MKLLLVFKIKQKLLCYAFICSTLFLLSCASNRKPHVTGVESNKVGNKAEHKVENKAEYKSEENAEQKENRKEAQKADKVVHIARSFIGTPYKYGGTTRTGMDCSGLLLNSFRAVDISLPRTSSDQSKVGIEVKIADLQPGDLVFFATGKKRNQITHVGLITERKAKDNIKFIHSSSSLGVVETNLFAEYYQKRYQGARRVLD